jgi:hypothetical protein
MYRSWSILPKFQYDYEQLAVTRAGQMRMALGRLSAGCYPRPVFFVPG